MGWLLREDCGEIVDAESLFNSETTVPCTPEAVEERAAAECLAKVAGKGAYVGALAAVH